MDPAPLEPEEEGRSNQNHDRSHLFDPHHEPSDSEAFPPSKTNPVDETSKHAINSSHSMVDLDQPSDQTLLFSNATNKTKQEIQLDEVTILSPPLSPPPPPPHSAVEGPVQGESVSSVDHQSRDDRDKQQQQRHVAEQDIHLKPNLLKMIQRYFSHFVFYHTELKLNYDRNYLITLCFSCSMFANGEKNDEAELTDVFLQAKVNILGE